MSCARSVAGAVAGVCGWLIAASAPAGEVPSGWTGLLDATGRCMYAVPPAWPMYDSLTSRSTLAASPDGSATAVIRWSARANWQQFESELRAELHPRTVHEQSGAHLWIEYASTPHDLVHLSAIPGGAGVCILEIALHGAILEPTRRVVEGVLQTLTSIR